MRGLDRQSMHGHPETAAWQAASNAKQRGVDWQFKVDDARRKLKSIYPEIIA